MTEAMSDSSQIIQRVRAGEDEALAEFFHTQRGRLRRLVEFRLDPRLRGRLDPDDILQEGYLAAVKRKRHFRGDDEASLFVWLRLVVQQTLVDAHRRHLGAKQRDAYRETPLHRRTPAGPTSASLAVTLVGSLTTPTLAVRRAELSEQLAAALEQMDPTDREVLALRHFEELTNQEVAEELGIQQKAASIRYVRALKRLKRILSDLPEFCSTAFGGV